MTRWSFFLLLAWLRIIFPQQLPVSAEHDPCEVLPDTEKNKPCKCVTGCGQVVDTDHLINAAFNKYSKASSEWSFQETLRACNLVDGRLLLDTTTSNPSCFLTGRADYRPWWQVDLGRLYTISHIHLYPYEPNGFINNTRNMFKRLQDLNIFVDGLHCMSFEGQYSADFVTQYSKWVIDGVMKVPCDTPVTGRLVRLQRLHTEGIKPFHTIGFCEVVIEVCEPGFFMKSGKCVEGDGNCPYPIDNLYGCVRYPGRLANVAIHKRTSMISVSGDIAADKTVDGLPWRMDPDCSVTDKGVASQVLWWQVDLEEMYFVYYVVIINRAADEERLNDLWVHVENDAFAPGDNANLSSSTACSHFVGNFGESQNLSCSPLPPLGRYVVVSTSGVDVLQLCEVQVFAQKIKVFKVGQKVPRPACNLTVCENGSVIDGDACKLTLGDSCGDREGLCRSGLVCEALRCILDVDGDCFGHSSSLCRQGTLCDTSLQDGPKCKYQLGQACADSAQCESKMTCVLGICKIDPDSKSTWLDYVTWPNVIGLALIVGFIAGACIAFRRRRRQRHLQEKALAMTKGREALKNPSEAPITAPDIRREEQTVTDEAKAKEDKTSEYTTTKAELEPSTHRVESSSIDISQSQSFKENIDISQSQSFKENTDISQSQSFKENTDISQSQSFKENTDISQSQSIKENTDISQSQSSKENMDISQSQSFKENTDISESLVG